MHEQRILALPEEPKISAYSKKKENRKILKGLGTSFVSLALAAACSGTPSPTIPSIESPTNPKTEEPEKTPEQIAAINLSLPFNDIWFYTGGPHYDGLSNEVKYAVDFAPPEVVPCPGGLPLENEIVIASESGKVTKVGNQNDQGDPSHSIVEVEDANGFTVGYMHLDNIPVKVGQDVSGGDPLGNPSCETPPGGKTTGIHLHEYLKKDGKPIPIAGTLFSGWDVEELQGNYQGTMQKEINGNSILLTADTGRWTPESPGPNGIYNVIYQENATETPTPTETENLTPEEAAKAYALDFWISTLNSSSVNERNTALMTITNVGLKDWLDNGQKEKLLKGELLSGDQVMAITVNWDLGEVLLNPQNPAQVRPVFRYAGILQTAGNYVDISRTIGLSDEDRARGIEWRGVVGVHTYERYKATAYKYFYTQNLWVDQDTAAQDLYSINPDFPFDYSSWNSQAYWFDMVLINGQWIFPNNDNPLEGTGSYAGIKTPSLFASPIWGQFSCGGDNCDSTMVYWP